jgi:hypothetical protein
MFGIVIWKLQPEDLFGISEVQICFIGNKMYQYVFCVNLIVFFFGCRRNIKRASWYPCDVVMKNS